VGQQQQQQQWIANYLTMKNQATEIWRNLRFAGGRELRDEPAFNVQKPIAVPSRMSHLPLLPIAETDGKTAISLEHALGLHDIPVGSRKIDVVTPGFQNSSVTKGGSVGLDSNLCDLDDLMTPWSTSTIPSVDHIPDLHPDLPPRLLHGHCEGVYDMIEVYTDGSFASHAQDEDNLATWAIAICGRRNSDDPIHLLDWFGDYVIDDALDQQWVGATRQHIREAEATALIWTAFYMMAHHPAAKLVVYSDALAVLNSAKGRWTTRPEEHIGVRLRAVFQVLERLRERRNVTCRHVKSHSGVLGNELVDAIANAIRKGTLSTRPPPRHYAWWLHGSAPRILRANILLDTYTREDVPPVIDDQWTYTAAAIPASPTRWLTENLPSSYGGHLRLKVTTFNVNTVYAMWVPRSFSENNAIKLACMF